MRILVASPRVAPGLLTLSAWDALRSAGTVRAKDIDEPHVQAIINAGIEVEASSAIPAYEADTVWIAPAGDDAWAQQVATDLMDTDLMDGVASVEILFGSYDAAGSKVLDLVEVLDQLRLHCPWTKEQTHASLSHYLLEEAHETLEALDSGDSDHLREELGDLLMQVVFHARIAAEGEGWNIDDVAEGIVTKLIYRNPHVFGDATVASAEDVDANWQALKALEKQRTSPFEGIAATLPALAMADKVLDRLDDAPQPGDDIGGRLLALVVEARAAGVNAEEALRNTIRSLVRG